LEALLKRRIDLEEYLVGSTVLSIFLQQAIAHFGTEILLGYPIVVLNSLILLTLRRLNIHRYHAAAILLVGAASWLAARKSGTPLNAIIVQLGGITVMSAFYFSALTTSGISVMRWMELYSRIAFAVAVFGILRFTIGLFVLHENRLIAIYTEPSFFVYATLPAVGFYINIWDRERRYGAEVLIFLLSYALAASSIGFMGLMAIGFFTFIRRITPARIILGAAGMIAAVGALFVASGEFRVRLADTVRAIATMDLAGTNFSTFALLSNAYIAGRTFMAHPFLGVGIGGYQFVYATYITDITGIDLYTQSLNLNMFDANSMIFRLAAELGSLGLILLFSFIIICARVRGHPYVMIRNALLPYILVRTFRLGAYFTLELYFFLGLYLLNYLESRMETGPRQVAIAPRPVYPAAASSRTS
jgi:hypothetical protein